jgi:hypothetical protein
MNIMQKYLMSCQVSYQKGLSEKSNDSSHKMMRIKDYANNSDSNVIPAIIINNGWYYVTIRIIMSGITLLSE